MDVTPKPRKKPGRQVDRDSLEGEKEMVRLLDGKPVTMRALAKACGLDVSTICRRVNAARQAMEPCEQWSPNDADDELSPGDQVYFEKRYRSSHDPDVRALIESNRTRLRRRP